MAGCVLHLKEEENIVLSSGVVKRMIDSGSGDACLLYLCLKRSGDAMDEDKLRAMLRWEELRFDSAKQTLAAAGLISVPEKKPPEEPKRPRELPEYSREDVMRRLEEDNNFSSLLREVERKLGPLSIPSTGKLLGLHEELGLPCEVIYLLINHCIGRKEQQFGIGRLPTMREIEKTGYAWARRELFSTQRANEFLKREEALRSRYPAYMTVLQMPGRAPSPSEEKYLQSWSDMGFPPETVAIAYDKTVLHCHEFKWTYCNGILKNWHQKNLHTPDAVSSENCTGGKTEKETEPTSSRKAGMRQYIKP